MKRIFLFLFGIAVFGAGFFYVIAKWAENGLVETVPYKMAYYHSLNDTLIQKRVGVLLSIGENFGGEIIGNHSFMTFEVKGEKECLVVYFEFKREGIEWVISEHSVKKCE